MVASGGTISSREDWAGRRNIMRARNRINTADRISFMLSRPMKISLVQWTARTIPAFEWRCALRPIGILCFCCVIQTPINCAAQTHSDPSAYKRTILGIQEKIESGDLQEARALVAHAAGIYPRDGGIENLLGVIEIEEGHTDAAAQAFSNAIRHSPGVAGPYLNLSRIKMTTAADDMAARAEALRLSLRAIELEPANDEAHYQAATILSWNKEYSSSLQHLQRLTPESRSKIGAEALLCSDYAAIGDREKTSEAARSMENNRDLTEQDAHTCLSNLRAARRADLIEELFSAAAARQALSPDGLRVMGLAQEAEGKLKLARSTLESAFAT